MDLAASQLEDVMKEIGDTLGGQGALVRRLQARDHRLLPARVAERHPAPELVLVQAAHQLDAPVDRREQLAVDRVDRCPPRSRHRS
jgi:hypothetical protein